MTNKKDFLDITTLWRRYKNKEKLSIAHKKHAYQRLSQSGWSHSQVVISSMMLNMVLFGLIYFISNVYIAFIIAVILLYFIVRFVDGKMLFK